MTLRKTRHMSFRGCQRPAWAPLTALVTLLMPVANGYAQTVRAASVPTAVGVLPDEIFAAWEQPELFVTALCVAFRSLRPTN